MPHLVWLAVVLGVPLGSLLVWRYVRTAHTRKHNRAVRHARRRRIRVTTGASIRATAPEKEYPR